MWGDIIIAFSIAFMTAFMGTPYTIKLAKKLGAVDSPNDERRINKVVMPRLRRSRCFSRIYSFNVVSFNCTFNRRYN